MPGVAGSAAAAAEGGVIPAAEPLPAPVGEAGTAFFAESPVGFVDCVGFALVVEAGAGAGAATWTGTGRAVGFAGVGFEAGGSAIPTSVSTRSICGCTAARNPG